MAATLKGPSSLEPNDPKAVSTEDLDDGGGSRQNFKGASKSNAMLEKERKIGHRRVNEEGEVSYKKIQTNQLMASIQLGIQYSISSLTKFEERDLLMQDFMTVESTFFPRNGSQQTPAHPHSEFTFRTYAPVAFRYFHKLFGIQREDFLMSICNEPMRELSNPGASGSIFYLTNDDEFILKTVQHKEAEFLQKLLPGYFMNLNQNPHTLLPKFFGMFCYHCNQKNIRLTVMNNILPSSIKMHLKFDLKGSTYKRKANKSERAKNSPTYKDLDFMDLLPEGLLLEQETYNALISTLRRDCRVLESFRIMDYSLLIGVHNLDQSAREDMENSSGDLTEDQKEAVYREKVERLRRKLTTKKKMVAHSTAMESIQAQTDPIDGEDNLPPGGIPARNHKGERLLLYLGIIDILQSYRLRKKLEHTLKAFIHDADTVSVHRPGFYAHRFLDFMADRVFKKIPSPLKHSPSKKGKRDSIKKRTASEKDEPVSPVNGQGGGGANPRPDVVPGNGADDESDFGATPNIAADRQSAKSASKPKNRQVKKIGGGNAETRSMGEVSLTHGDHHGTPSHLSVGGSSGWNTPTPTWTEGTPSFTDSSRSVGGGLEGGLGNPATRTRLTTTEGVVSISGHQRIVTTPDAKREIKLPTCSFTETEM